jgi:hypothetical protein
MLADGPQNTYAKQTQHKRKIKAAPRVTSSPGDRPSSRQPVQRHRTVARKAPGHRAPHLKPEQRHVLKAIVRVGHKRGASHKEIKAAVETGLVESRLRNLRYGDSDSQGWRQERKSIYGNPTNLHASIHRFFDETSSLKKKYERAGDLAAAVQRPAAQYRSRYEKRSSEADRLLALIPERRHRARL